MSISKNLKIKKRTQPEWLIFFIIVMPFLFGTLIDLLSLPSTIKYTIDISWLLLLFLAGVNLNKNKIAIEKNSIPTYIWVACFLAFTLVVYIFRYQSALYYLWGFRNNFRFYILFFALILFLNKEDIDDYLKLFDVIFWLNALVCFIQYFAFGLKGDHLGGFFGAEKGCNAYLNIFMAIVIIKSVVYCLNKKESILLCISKCSVALVIAVFSELKFFFAELFIILLVAVFITDFSARKLVIFAGAFAAIVVFASVLSSVYPHFDGFLSLNYFVEMAKNGGYSSAEQLNRLTTVPVISKEILTTPALKLFGMGLGNCDTATYEFLKTPFYHNYIYLRYNWFSTAFIFVETGFIGLAMFFGFFVLVGVKSFFMARKNKEISEYCQMAVIAAIVCVMIGIYNSSLRTEAAYMIYFMLALPFIAKKDTSYSK